MYMHTLAYRTRKEAENAQRVLEEIVAMNATIGSVKDEPISRLVFFTENEIDEVTLNVMHARVPDPLEGSTINVEEA